MNEIKYYVIWKYYVERETNMVGMTDEDKVWEIKKVLPVERKIQQTKRETI